MISLKYKSILLSIAILTLISGCSFNGEPRPRLGSYATATPGTNFIDTKNLGRHCYENGLIETNGILYTCRGGHIDIAHLRIAADYTKFLSKKAKKNISQNDDEITFKLNVEPSSYLAKISYPENWGELSKEQKEKITEEVSLELGAYFTFTMTTWHEILTWFGYKCMMILPENASAFSWEDIYSNLLGIRIATEVITNKEFNYNHAITDALSAELEYLGVQPRKTAKKAAESMRGTWYDGLTFVNMRYRNMDIGLDDGFVTPSIIGSICEEDSPQTYPIPKLEKFNKYGFKLALEIQPREFESSKILKVVYPDGGGKKIYPAEHLPILVEYIRNVETKKGNRVVPVASNL